MPPKTAATMPEVREIVELDICDMAPKDAIDYLDDLIADLQKIQIDLQDEITEAVDESDN